MIFNPFRRIRELEQRIEELEAQLSGENDYAWYYMPPRHDISVPDLVQLWPDAVSDYCSYNEEGDRYGQGFYL